MVANDLDRFCELLVNQIRGADGVATTSTRLVDASHRGLSKQIQRASPSANAKAKILIGHQSRAADRTSPVRCSRINLFFVSRVANNSAAISRCGFGCRNGSLG